MSNFVDQVTLHLRAGDGGDGCVSIRREKFKPLAGPDGGDGGNAGDIIVQSDPQVTTLLGFQRAPHRKSENGGPGMGDNRTGFSSPDLVLKVPVGTVVKDPDGKILADLSTAGMSFVAAEGGQGGLGNASLANTKRKAPGFALLGTPGWQGDIVLELKVMADVALVGYPSAGKSSLIAAMSAARPKIADYPFTTLQPNLGVVDAEGVRYTIADVPGLIEGASEGKGLGLEFLRHIERCSVIVHVLDCATLEPGRDPISDLQVIQAELKNYDVPDGGIPLLERSQVVALNKVDVPEAKDLADLVKPEIESLGFEVFEVSAATHQGLREFSFALAKLVEENRVQQPEAPVIVLRPKPIDSEDFTIKVEGGSGGNSYRVFGRKPERWVAQTDFENDEAVGYLADRLAKLGVEDALVKAGAVAGSKVVIGAGQGVEFDWEPTLTSTAELITSPRGTDSRLDATSRPSRASRREDYFARMDAKAEARAELEREREAGLWNSDADFLIQENNTEDESSDK